MQADGAGVPVELEDGAHFHVRAISVAGSRRSQFPIGGHIGGCVGNGPVDVARELVDLVNRLIGRRFRTGSQHQGQVTAGRHAHDTDLFGIVAAFLGLAADHAHRPLTVFPGTLVNGKALRTRGAVHKTAVLIRSAGNQDHAGPVGVGGFVEPLQIRHAILVGIEPGRLGHIGHGRNLVFLDIRHLAGRPDGLALPRKQA